MNTSIIKRLSRLCLLPTLAVITAGQIKAVDLAVFGTNLPPVDFHGFTSQGFIDNTGNNNYLGGSSSHGTFDFREYGVNASIATGKWRVGAQGFGYKLGPYGDDRLILDWASVDYQAAQWFGLRAGRVKTPRGLYNEALDLDSTRPFVLLPQSVYDARLRDFQASFDGGMGYGNIDLKSFGSLDYKVYGGHIPMNTKSGASDYFNIDAPFPNIAISMDDAFGASLFWNTPVQGLRVGYSFSDYQNFDTIRYVDIPHVIQEDLYKNSPDYIRQLLSLEYTWGDWTFAAEGGYDKARFDIGSPGGPATVFLYQFNYYGYASAAWRANHWLQLGAYTSYYHWQQRGENVAAGLGFPNLNQSDTALSARFDLTDYLLFKIEGHYMYGAGAVFNLPQAPQPVPSREQNWLMLTTKLSFSF